MLTNKFACRHLQRSHSQSPLGKHRQPHEPQKAKMFRSIPVLITFLSIVKMLVKYLPRVTIVQDVEKAD